MSSGFNLQWSYCCAAVFDCNMSAGPGALSPEQGAETRTDIILPWLLHKHRQECVAAGSQWVKKYNFRFGVK